MLTEKYYFFKLLRYVKQQRLVTAWRVWAMDPNLLEGVDLFSEWFLMDAEWITPETWLNSEISMIIRQTKEEIYNGDWIGIRTEIVFEILLRSIETKIGYGECGTMDGVSCGEFFSIFNDKYADVALLRCILQPGNPLFFVDYCRISMKSSLHLENAIRLFMVSISI